MSISNSNSDIPNPPEQDKELPPEKVPSPKRKGLSMPMGIVLLVFSFIAGLLIASWFFQTQVVKTNNTASNTPTATEQKKIVVGTDATLPPMEYIENGTMVGYDIDLANALGRELNAEIEFKNIMFDDLFTSLESKEIDMIISAVTITDERKSKYDFSEPYLNAGQVIITKKTNTTISSTVDLKGKRIAVQAGTTNEKGALNYTSNDLVIRYPDFEQAATALINGQVDAVFNDLPGGKGITTKYPDLKIASDPFTNEYYGVVLRKNDPYTKSVDEALAAIRVKGILTDLKQKWLD